MTGRGIVVLDSFLSIFRLRDTLSAIKAAQQTISDNTERLNEFITEDEDRRIFVSLRFSFLVLRCEIFRPLLYKANKFV